jgi:hypothetical protein
MSTFSFDDFDALLDAAASTASPPGSSVHPPSLLASSSSASSTHGESYSFVEIGSALFAGGGRRGDPNGNSGDASEATAKSPSKRVGLLMDPSPEVLCMGMISTVKFCTRALLEGGRTCGAMSHGKKFQPPLLSAFVKDTEVRALCYPVLDLSLLSPAQKLRIQGVNLTAEEWVQLFELIRHRTPPKWLAFDESPAVTLDTQVSSPSIEILSPTNMDNGGLLNSIPMLSSFDDSVTSDGDVDPELTLAEVTSFIRKFRSHFSSLKGKWHRAFTEVEAGYGLLVQDLQRLHSVAQAHSTSMGQPEEFSGSAPESLWQGLSAVHESVTSVAATVQAQGNSIDTLAVDQSQFTHSMLALESQTEAISSSACTQIAALTLDLRALEGRFLRLVPILSQMKRGAPQTASSATVDPSHVTLTAKVANCEQSLLTLKNRIGELSHLQTSYPASTAVESSLKELRVQMKQLQLKVVGRGVQIANKTFQTFEDVKTWVDTHLPNHRYGLFVDGVSIFEFFSAGHIDAETTYSSFYSQHRTGFKSTFEARVASSVQNLFPGVFGKSDSNVDTAEALPALSTPERWDSNDGNTGLRYQIMRNMSDVELQLQETITTVLGDFPEAQHIARECLHQAKRFALELCQFITLDFQKWKHRGHSKKDAWKMTAVCVRRIFEELYSERVVARDVYDQANPTFTTGKYLWATWKAHAVMARYLKHQFYEHPSISAVLARHLADNYVKPDDAQGTKIKSLENQIKHLETTQSTLQSKYDALRVAFNNMNSLLLKDPDTTSVQPAKQPAKQPKNWKGTTAPGSG